MTLAYTGISRLKEINIHVSFTLFFMNLLTITTVWGLSQPSPKSRYTTYSTRVLGSDFKGCEKLENSGKTAPRKTD